MSLFYINFLFYEHRREKGLYCVFFIVGFLIIIEFSFDIYVSQFLLDYNKLFFSLIFF